MKTNKTLTYGILLLLFLFGGYSLLTSGTNKSSESIKNSQLIVKEESPKLSDGTIGGKLNVINGASAECAMNNFFVKDDWEQIKGEIGRNGIDGLYIKRKGGVVKEVLVAESKFNKSKLSQSGKDNLLKQMSKDWILKTLEKLKKKNPNMDYNQIKKLVENNQYRARLFKLIPEKEKLQIFLYRLKNKGSNDFEQFEDRKIADIDINNPKNSFEKKLIDSYNSCRQTYLKKYLNILSSKEINELLKDNYIEVKDVKRVLSY